MENNIETPCILIEQPIGKFYVGVLNASDLLDIAQADIRRIKNPKLDEYLGIQRRVTRKRVREIETFANLPDATFPGSIVLAISSEDAWFSEKAKTLSIKRRNNVASIIDGQHRIAGLENNKNGIFQIPVTIFIDMDIEQQAFVFSTINLAQSRINRSLLYDLYEYAKLRSPQKTAHDITKLLNRRKNSPLQNKIKILGVAQSKRRGKQNLTQAIVVDILIEFISGSLDQARIDRDNIKMGKKLDNIERKEKTVIFRRLFIENKDAQIALIIWNYINAVKRKWRNAWEDNTILNSKNGFRALMHVLPLIYKNIDKLIPSEDDFFVVLNKIPFNKSNFQPLLASKDGEERFYSDLVKALGLNASKK